MGFEMPVTMAVWIGIAILLGIVEIMTPGSFFFLFFALGALVASVASLTIDSVLIQTLVFIAVSVVLVLFARPILKRTLNIGDQPKFPSNVSALINTDVLVLEDVDRYKGKVKVAHTGEVWSAYMNPPHDGAILTIGSVGTISKIDGAKLAIIPKDSSSS